MTLDRSSPPAPAPIRHFDFPRVAQQSFDNGVSIYTARYGDLPLVTIRAVIDAGVASEPRNAEGVAWLTANALEGGTTRRDGEDLAWKLEGIGADLEIITTWDALSVQLTARSDQLAAALDLLAEIVREPAFGDREVERFRNEQLAEILRRTTEPRSLADDAAVKYIFAKSSAYARPLIGIEERVQSLGSSDVRAFHEQRFTPGNTAVVFVGRFDPAAVLTHTERAFGDWRGKRKAAPAPKTKPGPSKTTVFLVDRPSAVQSELRFGHVGVPRHHEDYYPLLVLNTIIGGAFTSRLNRSLREKHGFTYGVHSNFAFRRGPGPFVIQTAVASNVTARAIEETLRELQDIRDNGVTDDEVKSARDYIAGTLPLQMQTTEQIARRVTDLHVFDLGIDYFDHYRERIGSVTRADVERVAREHLHPDRLAIVVVGNAADVEADLRSIGIDVVTDSD